MNPNVLTIIFVSYIASVFVNCDLFQTLLPGDRLEKQLNTTESSFTNKSYTGSCAGILCRDGRCVPNILFCADSNVSTIYGSYAGPCAGILCRDGRCVPNILFCADSNVSVKYDSLAGFCAEIRWILCRDGRCVPNVLLCADSNVSTYNSNTVHKKELLMRRGLMFYYAFAAFTVFTILGIVLYCSSVSPEEHVSNGQCYEAKYTAPVKGKKSLNSVRNLPNVRSVSDHPNRASTLKSAGDTEGNDYWWDSVLAPDDARDDDQEVYSSEMRPELELFRV